jgi:hypothetical protein
VIAGIQDTSKRPAFSPSDSSLRAAAVRIAAEHVETMRHYSASLRGIVCEGLMNIQFAIKDDRVT